MMVKVDLEMEMVVLMHVQLRMDFTVQKIIILLNADITDIISFFNLIKY